jgi:hypothetical protein
MNQTRSSPAAWLLEVGTCPTSASAGVAHLHEEVQGTNIAVHDSAATNDQKSQTM